MASKSADTRASGGGGPIEAADALSTDFPFSFDNFMDNFSGWSTSATAARDTTSTSVAGPERSSTGLCINQEGAPGRSVPEGGRGGFGFLFNPTASGNDNGENSSFAPFEGDTSHNLASFFPTTTAASADAEGVNLSFDFASFFLNNEEANTDATETPCGCEEDKIKDAKSFTKAEEKPQQNTEALPPPPSSLNRVTATDQQDESPNSDSQKAVSLATTAQNTDKAPTESGRQQQASLKMLPPSFSSHRQAVAHQHERDVVNAKENAGVAKSHLTPVAAAEKVAEASASSEITLAAALAAAPASPHFHDDASLPATATPQTKSDEDFDFIVDSNEEDEDNNCSSNSINTAHRTNADMHEKVQCGCPITGDELTANEEFVEKRHEVQTAGAAEAASKANEESLHNVRPPPKANACAERPSRPIAKLPPQSGTTLPEKLFLSSAPRFQRADQMTPNASPAAAHDSDAAPASSTSLANLIAEAQRACAQAAAVERAASAPAPPANAANTSTGTHGAPDRAEGRAAMPTATTSDAVFFAEVAQLEKQAARLSDETAKSAAAFQAQTGDFLRLLGSHVGLSSLLGEGYAATPVVHLAPYLISLLESLLEDDSEEEAEARATAVEEELDEEIMQLTAGVVERKLPNHQPMEGDECHNESAAD